ncbi:MAG: molybdate ABC transporter ATP-binding protein ModF [Rubritalea sp.]|uniref:molybdate ABC transporter ATP-binding protein ModF n=1 Tax=Rubritalea sp. TaxID=2109375 RepID=UPI0032426669
MHNHTYRNHAVATMPIIKITNKPCLLANLPQVLVDNFSMSESQNWAILGGNGSGKSTFARMLKNADSSNSAQLVSFEDEQALLEREIYEDDSEWINQVDNGRTTRELIVENLADEVNLITLIETLHLHQCIDTGFKLLSTGERRRLMLARALAANPKLLILDEPYDGLDKEFSAHLAATITEISKTTPTVLIINRLSHLSELTTHIACLHQMELVYQDTKENALSSKLFRQLQSSDQDANRPLPARMPSTYAPYLPTFEQAIVSLKDIRVAYHNKVILDGLDLQIMPDQHWKISGPNGCGKSTLVNLISGDHPQCYSNDIHLFGQKRGNGESIWEVKHHMGLMSTSLHQQYRITVTAETVILSGFFDTIGVYRPVTAMHKQIANEWLVFLGLDKYKDTHFQQLSFGQQRMLLIARALIKRPYLLILDEPCQGLDPINRALVIQLIDQIAERKIAQIIYISHEQEDKLLCLTHELKFTPIAGLIKTAQSTKPPYSIQIVEL